MVRIKKLTLAAIVALALTVGGVVAGAPQTQLAFSWGATNSGIAPQTEPEQLAGGKDPEIPSTPGILAGGKDPELPSTPGLA